MKNGKEHWKKIYSTFDYQSRGIGREEIQTAIGDDQLQELGGVMEPELGVEEEVLTGSIE